MVTALLLPLVGATPATERASAASLQSAFAAASARHGVPQSVLLGVSYLQSRWDAHGGAPSVAGGYGPMHLTDARTALGHAAAAEGLAGGQTLDRAARLTGRPAAGLRRDPAANIDGGAALLADAQRRLGRPLSKDAGDWYGAVGAYSGAADRGTARGYADAVFETIRGGAARTTDSGQRVALPPAGHTRPATHQLTGSARGEAECPAELACEWVPAPYEEFEGADGEPDYGNHDRADRPRDQEIRYIVIHDTEGGYDGSVRTVQDPEAVSWQYTLRSADGHIAQHVQHEDVAWHAGNWHVNSQSIGLEHEGILTRPDAWYTEAMYRSSARLVRQLARTYGIPLDRQHIIGHDNVPAATPELISGMHTDPGPYWDWAHYFDLLGKPFEAAEGADAADAGLVTVLPEYDKHRPRYTACEGEGTDCPRHGSGAVRLHTAPRAGAPLLGGASRGVNDTGARASTGQQYAVAGRRGAWTAIWYQGEKAWFKNPAGRPTAVPARGEAVTPKSGPVQVYGRVLPEAAAYPERIEPVRPTPLPYKLAPGQKYALGDTLRGEHFNATEFDGTDTRVVRGRTEYHEIQFGHRLAYVKAADVRRLQL